MTSSELLREWVANLDAMEIVDTGDRNATAQANMEMFAIANAQDAGVTVTQLVEFLREAHRAYSRAASRAGLTGWFYAWHDEMDGHLRMGACPRRSVNELPFGGRFTVVDDPFVLAQDAMASQHTHGIPWSEFVETSLDLPEPAAEPFRVYAQPL